MDFVFRRSYRGTLKAVIVDWAGTIVDYGCYAPAIVFVQVFQKQGVDITLEEARIPMGTQKKDHIRLLTQMPSIGRRWQEVHGQAVTEEDIEALYQAFIPMQLACLAEYAAPIPGTQEAMQEFRQRGLKIGSSTGYNRAMLEVLLQEASKIGLWFDSSVSASDVPAGRPAPFMCLQNIIQMGVYPMEAVVKIGDTVPDIEEGLNAGIWTVGVAKTGNEIGLTEAEIAALPRADYQKRLAGAYQRLQQAGADYVIDSIADIAPILDSINARLAQGERP